MRLTRRQFLIGASALSLLQIPDRASAQTVDPTPLYISEMRKRSYPGSDIVIEQKLNSAATYDRFICSYQSDGLKIYAYLTVPRAKKPDTGFPVVIFNHGFIPPTQYRTTEKYIAYQDAFARQGYIVFRSDYRGHDKSEGEPSGGYGTPNYTIDVLNGLGAIKRFAATDVNRIGMWGHSMGGHITLRSMVVTNDIKAGVIWAGVVGSYADLLERWRRRNPPPTTGDQPTPLPGRRWRQEFVERYGEPSANPTFWNAISPIQFVSNVAPISIHHGTRDTSVPIEFSESLATKLKENQREYEFFIYQGDDHNLSKNLSLALRRSVAFFDKHVKARKPSDA